MSLEKLRQENLKRNAEMLASFSFDEIKEQIQPKRRASTSGSVIKKKKPAKEENPRRSLRLINVPPTSLKEDDLMKVIEQEQQKEKERKKARRLQGPRQLSQCLEDFAGETQSTDYLTNKIFHGVNTSSSWRSHRSDESLPKFVQRLKHDLHMSEYSVYKVVSSRVTCMEFHPSADKALLMVGSRTGEIAFLDVSNKEKKSAMLSCHNDNYVVSMIKAHSADPLRVITTGYDGAVCVTDIEKGVVSDAEISEDESFLSMDFLSEHTILKGSGSGYASVTDLREQKIAKNVEMKCFDARKCAVKSISVHPLKQGNLIAASTNGGTVCLWDIRHPKKWLKCLSLIRVTQWCSFSPINGSRLLTSSSSDQIRIYDTESLTVKETPETVIHHNNNTGRFVTPFRPNWLPNREDCFIVGSMSYPRQGEIFNAITGLKIGSLTDPWLQSINSIWAYQPNLNILAGGNSSGRISTFRH